MKINEYLILSMAVILITLGIANLYNLLNVVILVGTAFCIIMYVIVTVVSRNRLERNYKWLGIAHKELIDECNQLEIDLANQVKATDVCERLLVNQAEKNTLEKAGQVKVNIPYKYATSDEILDNMPNDTTSKQDLPFATIPPYIGQEVTVRYGGQIVTAPITNILEKEKGVRYKVKGTGRREYKIDEMELG